MIRYLIGLAVRLTLVLLACVLVLSILFSGAASGLLPLLLITGIFYGLWQIRRPLHRGLQPVKATSIRRTQPRSRSTWVGPRSGERRRRP